MFFQSFKHKRTEDLSIKIGSNSTTIVHFLLIFNLRDSLRRALRNYSLQIPFVHCKASTQVFIFKLASNHEKM